MRFLLIFLFVSRFHVAFSQNFTKPIPAGTVDSTGAFAQIDWENDAFQVHQRSVSDWYYSNGIRVAHLSNYWRNWPTRVALLKLAPNGNRDYTALYTFSAGQELYTPRDTKTANRPLYPNDRPYAGYLYLSWGLTTTDSIGARRLTSALTLGMIGPVSGAAEVQRGIHDLLGQPVPAGWGTQMKNDPAISYSVRYEGRAIPRFSPAFDVISDVEGTIGTLMNMAGMGGTVRMGLFTDYFRPTGLYDARGLSSRKFQCYAFIRVGFRAVLDNALMQGGWLNGPKITTPCLPWKYSISTGKPTWGVLLRAKTSSSPSRSTFGPPSSWVLWPTSGVTSPCWCGLRDRLICGLSGRDIDIESSALPRSAAGRNEAVVVGNDFFYDGQPNACTVVLLPSVQPLENVKYFFAVFWVETNAVVGHGDVLKRPVGQGQAR